MSGSRIARGRLGRLALLGCAAMVVIVLMLVYRSTSAEMTKLKNLHIKCAQQQEALAAQFQGEMNDKIFFSSKDFLSCLNKFI